MTLIISTFSQLSIICFSSFFSRMPIISSAKKPINLRRKSTTSSSHQRYSLSDRSRLSFTTNSVSLLNLQTVSYFKYFTAFFHHNTQLFMTSLHEQPLSIQIIMPPAVHHHLFHLHLLQSSLHWTTHIPCY